MLKFNKFLLFITLVVLISPALTMEKISATENGEELFLPERVEVKQVLTSDSTNDLFFKTNMENAILPHSYTSEEASYSLYSYDGDTKVSAGSFNPVVDSFMATDPTSIYHASNLSNSLLELTYSTVYYDLSGTNFTNQILLFEDEMSGFHFDAVQGEPFIIDFNLKGKSDTAQMNLYLISPSGEVFDYSSVTIEFQTFVNQFIPVVPTESGEYTLFLSPVNENLILETLHLYDSPPVTEISAGYTSHWTGQTTQTNFFKFTNITQGASLLNLDATVFYNDSVSSPDLLLGQLQINYFAGGISVFGNELTTTEAVVLFGDLPVYVAVTATPPNDDNQFIAGVKNDLGLPRGFDVEYAFWGQQFSLDEFTPNTDLIVEPVSAPNTNKYYWEISEDLILGMNSTNAAQTFITELVTGEVFLLDSTANDILGSTTHTAVILPAGSYMVEIKDSFSSNEARVYTLTTLALNLGANSNYVLSLGEPLLFRLPVTGPTKESFNLTYLGFGLFNASTEITLSFFDSTFGFQQSSSVTLEEYYNSGGSNRVSNNNTLIGNTNLLQMYNIKDGYMRIEMTGNTNYTSTGSIDGTNVDLQVPLNIARQNYLVSWQDMNPLNQYKGQDLQLANGVQNQLNGSMNQIVYTYSFTSTPDTGYNINLHLTNVSYTVYTYLDWSNTWFSVNVNSANSIDGINHYMKNLEFATNEELGFGIVVLFTPSANGTFSISLDSYLVQETGGITLGSASMQTYVPNSSSSGTTSQETTTNSSSSSSSFLADNGILIASVAAGIVAITGALIVLKRSGKI